MATTNCPSKSVHQMSFGNPHCYKSFYEWPVVPGNPALMASPRPALAPTPRWVPACCPRPPAPTSACQPCRPSLPSPPCPPCSRPTRCCSAPPAGACACPPCRCDGCCKRVPQSERSAEMCMAVRNCPGDSGRRLCPDHLRSLYKEDFCCPPKRWCLCNPGRCLCGTSPVLPGSERIPLGRSCGLPRVYHGVCRGGTGLHGGAGGGPRIPPPGRYSTGGIMGKPPPRYFFGRSEYQASVGRLGGQILTYRCRKAHENARRVGTRCRGPCLPPC